MTPGSDGVKGSQSRNRILFKSFIIFFSLTVWTPLLHADWTSLRGDAQGRAVLEYPGPEPLDEWYYQYKANQRYAPGVAVWASPALAVVEGRPTAFIGGYNQALLALDLSRRSVRWLKITNGLIASAPAIGTLDGIQAVYVGSSDRTLYALETTGGSTLWTRTLVVPSPTLDEADLSTPVLYDGRIYITAFAYDRSLAHNQQICSLFCLDQRTGEILQKTQIGNGFVSSPVGFLLDSRFCLAVAARKGLLQCWDVSELHPRLRWTYQMPHEVLGSPVLDENTQNPVLFLGSKFGNLIALDARTGQETWKHMAGNWIDNSACVGELDGRKVVFAGSYDYRVYAFDAQSGTELWDRPLGGEIYSAPCFFQLENEPCLAVAALDNHLYVLSARDGAIRSVYHTGKPLWDKVPKGETLWGSPVALQAGSQTALVHGSYNGYIFTIPLLKPSTLTVEPRSNRSLWVSLGGTAAVFLSIVLPVVLNWKKRG